jgi:predicted 2-oxoglutarate/Fe(II)-dependent dioxygenase YbiX
VLKQSILFTKEECDYIIDLKNKYPLLGDNGRWDEFDNFRYKFYTLEYLNDTDWIIKRMVDYFEKEMGLHIFHKLTKLNLHHYTIGDEFGKHIDTGSPIKEWNIGILLNDDFDGGDYIIFDENDNPIIIDKKVGNVYIFQSQIPHQVTPITNGERWAIAMFIPKFMMSQNKKII